MDKLIIDGNSLTLEALEKVALHKCTVELGDDSRIAVKASLKKVEVAVEKGAKVYGVTTGLGHLSEISIDASQTRKLQENLILTHCSGVGDEFPVETCRAMMLLRANALAKGFSGVRPLIIDMLLQLLNSGVTSVIFQQGSVGASGDLVPLAHMALLLIGKGQARYKGELIEAPDALKIAKLEALELGPKEALALVNGTQAMASVTSLTLLKAERLAQVADIAGAMSLEALGGTEAAFDERIQMVRPIPGQKMVAANVRKIVKGSLITDPKLNPRIQDAYSLRCIPQVHGSVREILKFARYLLEIEINSATDNPLIFPEDDAILSGGNFHGEPMAFASDFLAIGLSELSNISDRRSARLNDPHAADLPPSLSEHAGVGNCFGILQIVTASLVADNKSLAHPASTDSVPTSANQEDHVSMGLNAARKARDVAKNLEQVLAIELICAAQALDFVGTDKCGAGTLSAHQEIRTCLPWVDGDTGRIFHYDIKKVAELIQNNHLLETVKKQIGKLD